MRDLKFILNIGNFFEGPNLVKRPVGHSPQALKFGQATITLIRKPEKEWEQGATFQKRIASQRSAASRQLRCQRTNYFLLKTNVFRELVKDKLAIARNHLKFTFNKFK